MDNPETTIKVGQAKVEAPQPAEELYMSKPDKAKTHQGKPLLMTSKPITAKTQLHQEQKAPKDNVNPFQQCKGEPLKKYRADITDIISKLGTGLNKVVAEMQKMKIKNSKMK